MKNRITIHASMTAPDAELTKRDIDRRDRREGYAMIGYHYVIRRDGTIELGRPADQASVHDDLNDAKTSLSVCFIGGTDDKGRPQDNFTDEQWDGLCELLRQIGETRTLTSIVSKTPAVTSERVSRIVHRPKN